MDAHSKNIIFIIAAILILGTGFVLFQQKQTSAPQNESPTVNESSKIFELKLQDYSGNIIALSDFKGRSLVINSWAAWCPFCRKELADFAAVQKEFGDKVVIVAINRQESLATSKGYTDKQGMSNDLIFLLDPGDSFYRSIGGFSMPETIFINKNGDITNHKRGPMEINEMRQKINEIL